jgi:dihydrofolate reductase
MTRELVYTGFMSLDGVADSPGAVAEGHRSGGWVLDTEYLPEAFSLKHQELEDTTALKFVVSSTMSESELVGGWGPTTILRSTEEVAAAKQGDGGAIFIHGSAELARRLSDADLIDRYNLLVFPVLLGAGKRLFSGSNRDKLQLRLRESASYDNGVTKLVYDVER